MTPFDEVAQIILEALKLINFEESTKYQDRIIKLQEAYRVEERKPTLDEIPEDKRAAYEGPLRSDVVLADLHAKLRDTWAAARAAAAKASPAAV